MTIFTKCSTLNFLELIDEIPFHDKYLFKSHRFTGEVSLATLFRIASSVDAHPAIPPGYIIKESKICTLESDLYRIFIAIQHTIAKH